MAWNLDYTAVHTADETPTIANRKLSGSGKLVWALMPLKEGKYHKVVCFDTYLTYMSTVSSTESIDTPPQGAPSIITQFEGTDDKPFTASTIAADGDTCYAGMMSVGSSLTATIFDRIAVFHSWGARAEDIVLPELMNGDIVVAAGGLWMASYDISPTGVQILYNYDLTTKVWHVHALDVKHQLHPHVLAHDRNGYILHCDYNNLSVTKIPTLPGLTSATIRLAPSGAGANRQPNAITVGDDRQVYVASFQGMISKVNTASNTVTSFSNGLGSVHSFIDEGAFLWVATEKRPMSISYNGQTYTCTTSHMSTSEFEVEKWARGGDGSAGTWGAGNYYVDDTEDLIRINKSTNTIRHFGSSDRDIKIASPAGVPLEAVKVNSLLMMPSTTCGTSSGTTVIPKSIWAITEHNKILVMPSRPMFRQNYYQMDAVAMMSFGPHDYIGE